MSEMYRPEGRQQRQPIVEVRPSVINKLGKPRVDYEGLDELFRSDLGVATEVTPVVELYENSRSRSAGFYNTQPETRERVHLNMAHTVGKKGKKGIAGVLIHEGRHLADEINFPEKKKKERRLRQGVAIVSGLGAEAAVIANFVSSYPNVSPLDVVESATIYVGTLLYVNTRGYYHFIDPAERRARKVQKDKTLLAKYQNVIVF